MKTIKRIMTAMVALACMGMTVSCDKTNDDSNSLVGRWRVDNLTYDGRDMTPEDMVLVMNDNGTGDVLTNGHSDNDSFTWSVSGDVLTVYPNGGSEYTFTIVSISSTEASLTGNVVPGTDMQGNVTMHLTKVSGGDPTPDPDPNPDPNNYSTILPGNWQLDGLVHNGQDLSSNLPNIQLSFNANGTGLMSDGGETEHNEFSWVINGNNITITVHNGQQYTFTIVSITSTECTFSGTYLDMADIVLQGDIQMHMTKIQ
ncbi:MAG: lipocalin family protein [Bacteroidales bacterium]|nr:lipocalin family protein [Bacteroidales bacterium]